MITSDARTFKAQGLVSEPERRLTADTGADGHAACSATSFGHDENWTPEAEALMLGARLNPSPDALARLIHLLTGNCGPFDWKTLLSYAERQGVSALIFYTLRRVTAQQPDCIPREIMSALHTRFLLGATRNMQLTAELLRLLDLLRERDVPAIPYKGPVVAQAAYGNIALRAFCDLDILVHRRDLDRVHRLLTARGYERHFHATHESAEYAYKYVSDTATVEVHWNVLPRHYGTPLHMEEMWGRLRPLNFAGRDVLAPSPEDLLLLLCLHGYKHRWNRLEWVSCLAELARPDQPMDWKRLLRRATRTGSRRMVFLGLQLTRELVGANLPPLVTQAIDRERTMPALVAASRQAMLHAMHATEGGVEITEGEGLSFFHLKVRERLRDKLRYLAGFALSPNQLDWKVWRVRLKHPAEPESSSGQ